jgi:DNA-binding GntR family transcriptional regulator
MKKLAFHLGCSRLEVSNALNALADQERLILKRGIIEIPALQLL